MMAPSGAAGPSSSNPLPFDLNLPPAAEIDLNLPPAAEIDLNLPPADAPEDEWTLVHLRELHRQTVEQLRFLERQREICFRREIRRRQVLGTEQRLHWQTVERLLLWEQQREISIREWIWRIERRIERRRHFEEQLRIFREGR